VQQVNDMINATFSQTAHCSGVTTDPADPAMRGGGPWAYGGPKLWHYFFFTVNLTHQFSCGRGTVN